MNLVIVLVIITVLLNLSNAAPNAIITNDDLIDGKYLCEDLSALKLFDNDNDIYRPNEDISASSNFLNDFYNMYLKNIKRSLLHKIHYDKRNLDSIGGGHLIKRTNNNNLQND
ncbi:uncharacterized protein LOC6641001 isoform X2 [Drosophila willistoni]|uniref:uncharacterized protein LOC6641001 isoform X2 n=1 Tax=Drosophila willistoni TaxID=7260 RepID=UPI001F081355|nr:uncharacterized protein LOC6641001 isoform X2 [Drosophila willistoni]